MSTNSLCVEVINDDDAFAALQPSWNALCVQTAHPSPAMTFEWLKAWWEAFGTGATLHVLVVRGGERVLAAMPMMLHMRREAGLRWRVVSLLANEHSPVGGFLLSERPDECIDRILHHFRKISGSWDLLQFRELLADGAGRPPVQK